MKKLLLNLIMGSMFLSSSVFAASSSANFNSNTNLQSRCILTAQNLSFGNLNFIVNKDSILASGQLSILCSKGIGYTIVPDGGFRDGFIHIMRGSVGNEDGIYVSLRHGNDLKWSRASEETISGVGSGQVQTVSFGARTIYNGPVKGTDAARTNDFNHEAKPDNYSTTVTAVVTY